MAGFKRHTKEKGAFAESDDSDTSDDDLLENFGFGMSKEDMEAQKQRASYLGQIAGVDYNSSLASKDDKDPMVPGQEDDSEEEDTLGNKNEWRSKKNVWGDGKTGVDTAAFFESFANSISARGDLDALANASFIGSITNDDQFPLSFDLPDSVKWRREGFKNLGNTCYMNAVLQGLLHLSSFTSDLLDETVIENVLLFKEDTFIHALLDVLQRTCSERAVVNPIKVKEAVQLKFTEFAGWRQQDAHEFLISCLDQLHEEVAAVNAMLQRGTEQQDGDESCVEKNSHQEGKGKEKEHNESEEGKGKEKVKEEVKEGKETEKETAEKEDKGKEKEDVEEGDQRTLKRKAEEASIPNSGNNNNSENKRKKRKIKSTISDEQPQEGRLVCPTTDNFACVVLHELVCKQCGKTSKKKELYRDFSLEIVPVVLDLDALPEPASLQQLLQHHFMTDEREKKCRCGHNKADMKHSFNKLPRILVLHLKRFRKHFTKPDIAPTITKVTDRVTINDTIDVAFCCSSRTQEPRFPYRPFDVMEPMPPLLPPSPVGDSLDPFLVPENKQIPHEQSDEDKSIQLAKRLYQEQQQEIQFLDDFELPVENVPPLGASANDDKALELVDPVQPGIESLLTAMLEQDMNTESGMDLELEEVLKKSREEYEQASQLALAKEEEDQELAAAIALSMQEHHPPESEKTKEEKEGNSEKGQQEAEVSVITIQDEPRVVLPPLAQPTEPLDIVTTYRLCCAVMHKGSSVQAGHYVCYARQGTTDTFQLFDDELVTEISRAAAFTEQREREGYLFFYVHSSGLE